jgi:hypothetical protein
LPRAVVILDKGRFFTEFIAVSLSTQYQSAYFSIELLYGPVRFGLMIKLNPT